METPPETMMLKQQLEVTAWRGAIAAAEAAPAKARIAVSILANEDV